jgi:hypothetical protein
VVVVLLLLLLQLQLLLLYGIKEFFVILAYKIQSSVSFFFWLTYSLLFRKT